MLGLWAGLCLVAGIFASWFGIGGRAPTVTLVAFFLLVMLLFAARGVTESLASRLGIAGAFLLGSAIFVFYLFYLVGTGTFALARAGFTAGLVFLPLTLAASGERAAPGSWQDFLTLAGVWAAVKFLPMHWLWAYPDGRPAYVLTVLLGVNVAAATFLLLRRMKGVGYSIGWGRGWGLYVVGSFLAFGCIAIPLAHALRFTTFSPHWSAWKTLPLTSLGILFFTAWPEEFLFRGLLQNMLSRACKSDLAGWWTASVLFGFSHITNGGFPNWRYVALASLAGLFYGWTWRKTGSIFASAIVHAAVDITWHFLFR
jgi:membrane protease YdiL (CAAX protease family)